MTDTPMPVLQIRNANGGAWCVHAEFPDGSSADIKGFTTENDANQWIATELQHWLETGSRSPMPEKQADANALEVPAQAMKTARSRKSRSRMRG